MANKIDSAAKFYKQIATPESIAGLNGLLASSFLRVMVVAPAVTVLHQMHTNKSRSRYFWYLVYGGTALSSLVLFAGAKVAYYAVANAVNIISMGNIGWSRFETGILWSAWRQGGREGNLSFMQMMTLVGTDILSKPELFRMIDAMPDVVDMLLDVALVASQESKPEKAKVKLKKAEAKPAEYMTPEFYREDIVKRVIEAVKSVVDTRKDTFVNLSKNKKLLELAGDLSTLIGDEAALTKTLNLAEIFLANLEVKEAKSLINSLLQVAPQNVKDEEVSSDSDKEQVKTNKLPINIILNILPIVRKELELKNFKDGLSELTVLDAFTNMCLGFYEKVLAKDSKLDDKGRQAELERAENAIDFITYDETIIPNILELCTHLIKNDFKEILEVYNSPQTQAWLAELQKGKDEKKDPTAPVLPTELILTAMPLIRLVFSSKEIKGLVVALLSNEKVISAIKLFTPEEYKQLVGAVLQKDIIENILSISDQVVTSKQIYYILEALNKPEIDIGEAAEAFLPALQQALKCPEQLEVILKNKALFNAAMGMYADMLADERKKEVEALREILWPVIEDKEALPSILKLASIAVGKLEPELLKALLNAIPEPKKEGEAKDNKLPINLILAALPLVQVELRSDEFKTALDKLTKITAFTNMCLGFYGQALEDDEKLTVEKRKAELEKASEAIGFIVADETIVNNILDLCTQLVGNDFKAILEVYNGEQTQKWLTDPNATMLPTELIMAAMPLIRVIFKNEAIRASLTILLSNQGVVRAIKVYLPEEYGGLLDVALKEDNIWNALNLARAVIDGMEDKDIAELLNAINDPITTAYLKAIAEVKALAGINVMADVKEINIPVPSALVKAAPPILIQLLGHKGTKDNLNASLKGLTEFIPEELRKPVNVAIQKEALLPILELLKTTLETLSPEELMPIVVELAKREIDIAVFIPVLKKALENKLLVGVIKNELLIDIAMVGVEAQLALKLKSIAHDEHAIPDILNLCIITLDTLHGGKKPSDELKGLLDALLKDIPKDEELPLGITLAMLPLLKKLLGDQTIRPSIVKLLTNSVFAGIGLSFYKDSPEKAKANRAIDLILKDQSIITGAVELCSAIVNVVDGENLKAIVVAYNEKVKEEIPTKLIMACVPLLKAILANEAVRKVLITLLQNETLQQIILLYMPEKYEHLVKMVLVPDIINKVLGLLEAVPNEQIEGILNALNTPEGKAFLKALEEKKEPEFPVALITASRLVLKSLLDSKQLIILLQEPAGIKLLWEFLPKELKGPIETMIKDPSELIKLLHATLDELKDEELMPVLTEMLKKDLDPDKLLPVLKKLLESKSFKTKLTSFARSKNTSEVIDKVCEVVTTNAKIKAKSKAIEKGKMELTQEEVSRAKQEAEDMVKYMKAVIANDAFTDTLDLCSLVVGELKLKDVYNALPKEKLPEGHLPIDAILKGIPILQKELGSKDVRGGLEKLIKNDRLKKVGLLLYNKSLKGDDAKEHYSKVSGSIEAILADTTLITTTLSLCSAIANVLSVETLKPILAAYNGDQTQKWLAELSKEEKDKDPNAPALPAEFIKASMPLIRAVLGDKMIVAAISEIIKSPVLEHIVLQFYEKDSEMHKNFIWARDNIDGLLTLAQEISAVQLDSVIDDINFHLTKRRQEGADIKVLGKRLMNQMLVVVSKDSTGILNILKKKECTSIITTLLNSHHSVPVKFKEGDLHKVIKLGIPVIQKASEEMHNKLIEYVVEEIRKAVAIASINKAVVEYMEKADKVSILKEKVKDILTKNLNSQFFSDLKVHVSDIAGNNNVSYVLNKFGEEAVSGLDSLLNEVLEDFKINESIEGISILTEGLNFGKNILRKPKDIKDVKDFINTTLAAISLKKGDIKLEARLDMLKALLNDINLWNKLPNLLEAVKLIAEIEELDNKLKISQGYALQQLQNERSGKAAICDEEFAKFLAKLASVLNNVNPKDKFATTFAKLLDEVIPSGIKGYIYSYTGGDLKALCDKVVYKPDLVKTLVPGILKLAITGTGGITDVLYLFSHGSEIGDVVAKQTYRAVSSAISLFGTMLYSPVARYNYMTKVQPLYGILELSKSASVRAILSNIETYKDANNVQDLVFSKETYSEPLQFINIDTLGYTGLNLCDSNITNLQFNGCNISSFNAIKCTIDELAIVKSTFTNCDFKKATVNSISIHNATLDTKTFIELMGAIRSGTNSQVVIQGLQISERLLGINKNILEDVMSVIPSLEQFVRKNPYFKDVVARLYREGSVAEAVVSQMLEPGVKDKKRMQVLKLYINQAVSGLGQEDIKQLIYNKKSLVGTSSVGLLKYLSEMPMEYSVGCGFANEIKIFIAAQLGKGVFGDKIVSLDAKNPAVAAKMLMASMGSDLSDSNLEIFITKNITGKLTQEGLDRLAKSQKEIIGEPKSDTQSNDTKGLLQLSQSLSSSYSSEDSSNPYLESKAKELLISYIGEAYISKDSGQSK